MSSHAFLKLGNDYCKDYTIIASNCAWALNAETMCTNYGLDNSWPPSISVESDDIKSMLDTTAKPKKNSTIYVTPGCPISSADLRKNYQIKRDPDAADYNVFSDFKLKREWCSVCVIPSRKVAMVFNRYSSQCPDTRKDFMYIARAVPGYADVNLDDLSSVWAGTLGYNVVPDAFLRLYNGTLSKPAVSINQLDMDFGLELTDDVVELVYRTGMVDNDYGRKTEEKCLLELAALNQYNWRDYPRTMYLLTSVMKYKYRSTYHSIQHAPSRAPKSIKSIITTEFSSKAASQKDHDMSVRFMQMVLDIGDVKYVNYQDVYKKISQIPVSLDLFLNAFDTVVRIAPKKYEATNDTV